MPENIIQIDQNLLETRLDRLVAENEHQNILNYLIANKRYNAVAHIVQRFPAESGTYS